MLSATNHYESIQFTQENITVAGVIFVVMIVFALYARTIKIEKLN